jgi:predicted metal-dependent phosphoesterase TrpH
MAYPPVLANYDLHAHSHFSDGSLSPTDLLGRAKQRGVDVFALTDHDTLSGLDEAITAAKDNEIHLITGVEISVTWHETAIHVVGLGIDPHFPVLVQALEKVRDGRVERAKKMALGLSEVGISGAFEGAMSFVEDPHSISRTHFARFLVDQGICGTVSEVFTRFLVKGKPGYVPMQWADLAEAISWIKGAGGVAVVAHPGRYKMLPKELSDFFREFQRLGGEGLEVVTSSHGTEQIDRFAHWCRTHGLYASRGSDFHAPSESKTDLGAIPPLPPFLKPVWTHPRINVQ